MNNLSTKVKKMSITSIIFSLLFIFTGIFLLLKPETAINIVCYVLGVILVLWGVVSIIQFFSDKNSTNYLSLGFIFGAFVFIFGIIILIKPSIIASIVPLLLGVWMVINGVTKLSYSLSLYKTNKNILIKSWYVDNKDYYEKIKHAMITMANLTGARIYITLDRKDNVKLVQGLLHSYTDSLCAIVKGQKPAIKNLSKTFASETSKEENSSPKFRTIMFDVDTKEENIKKSVIDYIEMEHVTPKGEVCPKVKAHVLETKKGYHIFCFRKFNHTDWLQECVKNYIFYTNNQLSNAEILGYLHNNFKEVVSVKANELGLVYHPMKMKETFHDKLYNLVEPYLDGDFVGYNEEEQAFDIVQAVKEILENG